MGCDHGECDRVRPLSRHNGSKCVGRRPAAKYFGTASTRSTTIYGRANKRAGNFGTLGSDGVTAKANEAISAAFKAGKKPS